MGMPVTVEISDPTAKSGDIDAVFDYFGWVDATFSTYKPDSQVSRINDGRLSPDDALPEVREILKLAEDTKRETNGFFNIYVSGHMNPSGIVKGWAVAGAAKMLEKNGYGNYFVDAGGDIQLKGNNAEGVPWSIGIRDPFAAGRIVKTLRVTPGGGIATSGTYIRGQHIYDPTGTADVAGSGIVSLTVIGPDIYDADRFATAAFAMGERGLEFIGGLRDLDAYMIRVDGRATYTEGFARYVVPND
jgi:thiamine biosynthesis lipoprotein